MWIHQALSFFSCFVLLQLARDKLWVHHLCSFIFLNIWVSVPVVPLYHWANHLLSQGAPWLGLLWATLLRGFTLSPRQRIIGVVINGSTKGLFTWISIVQSVNQCLAAASQAWILKQWVWAGLSTTQSCRCQWFLRFVFSCLWVAIFWGILHSLTLSLKGITSWHRGYSVTTCIQLRNVHIGGQFWFWSIRFDFVWFDCVIIFLLKHRLWSICKFSLDVVIVIFDEIAQRIEDTEVAPRA